MASNTAILNGRKASKDGMQKQRDVSVTNTSAVRWQNALARNQSFQRSYGWESPESVRKRGMPGFTTAYDSENSSRLGRPPYHRTWDNFEEDDFSERFYASVWPWDSQQNLVTKAVKDMDKGELSCDQNEARFHWADLNRIVMNFADRTSMQGVPYIRNSESTAGKLVWSLLFLVCLSTLFGHLYYLFDIYYSYPKHSSIELGFSALSFPAVTFCNVNPIKKSELGKTSDVLRHLVEHMKPENIIQKMAAASKSPRRRKKRNVRYRSVRTTAIRSANPIASAIPLASSTTQSKGLVGDLLSSLLGGLLGGGGTAKEQPGQWVDNSNHFSAPETPVVTRPTSTTSRTTTTTDKTTTTTTTGPVTISTTTLTTTTDPTTTTTDVPATTTATTTDPITTTTDVPATTTADTTTNPTVTTTDIPATTSAATITTSTTTASVTTTAINKSTNPIITTMSAPSTTTSVTTTPTPATTASVTTTPTPATTASVTTTATNNSTYASIVAATTTISSITSTTATVTTTQMLSGQPSEGTATTTSSGHEGGLSSWPGQNEVTTSSIPIINTTAGPFDVSITEYNITGKDVNDPEDGAYFHDSAQLPDDVSDEEIRFLDDLDLGVELNNVNHRRKLKEEEQRNTGARVEPFEKPSLSASIREEFFLIYSTIEQENRSEIGHQVEDMMVDCSFAGRRCHPKNFSLLSSMTFGNCFTIEHPTMFTIRSGYQGGLSLVVFLESEEYLRGVTSGTGLQVVIHPQHALSFPEEDGITVMAGTETSISMRRVLFAVDFAVQLNINRIGPPHGVCRDGGDFLSKYGHTYTRKACQHFCEHNTVMDRCHCYDEQSGEHVHTASGHDLQPCHSDDDVRCLLKVQQIFEAGEMPCNCENPCSEQSYYKTVSMRQWPADEYTGVLIEAVCSQRDKAICDKYRQLDTRTIAQNFVKLNIFYEDLNYENITEVEDYELVQFASDVGGTVGLWVGLSILSGFEVLQFFFELFVYLLVFGPCRKKPNEDERSSQAKGSTSTESFKTELSGRV